LKRFHRLLFFADEPNQFLRPYVEKGVSFSLVVKPLSESDAGVAPGNAIPLTIGSPIRREVSDTSKDIWFTFPTTKGSVYSAQLTQDVDVCVHNDTYLTKVGLTLSMYSVCDEKSCNDKYATSVRGGFLPKQVIYTAGKDISQYSLGIFWIKVGVETISGFSGFRLVVNRIDNMGAEC
jgi:hypothetical protein